LLTAENIEALEAPPPPPQAGSLPKEEIVISGTLLTPEDIEALDEITILEVDIESIPEQLTALFIEIALTFDVTLLSPHIAQFIIANITDDILDAMEPEELEILKAIAVAINADLIEAATVITETSAAQKNLNAIENSCKNNLGNKDWCESKEEATEDSDIEEFVSIESNDNDDVDVGKVNDEGFGTTTTIGDLMETIQEIDGDDNDDAEIVKGEAELVAKVVENEVEVVEAKSEAKVVENEVEVVEAKSEAKVVENEVEVVEAESDAEMIEAESEAEVVKVEIEPIQEETIRGLSEKGLLNNVDVVIHTFHEKGIALSDLPENVQNELPITNDPIALPSEKAAKTEFFEDLAIEEKPQPDEETDGTTKSETDGKTSGEKIDGAAEESSDEFELEANSAWDEEQKPVLTVEQVEQIPPPVFAALKSEQLTEFSKEAVSGMTTEQFAYLPIETLGGLTSANMGGLSLGIVNELTPKHVNALQESAVKNMPTEEFSKLLTNLDPGKITPSDVEKLVPPDWQLEIDTGILTAPVGAKITLRYLPETVDLPSQVILPPMPDLNSGFGIGGRGPNILSETLESQLDTQQELSRSELSQDQHGVLKVQEIDDENLLFAFMPEADNVIQTQPNDDDTLLIDEDRLPSRLSLREGGFYTITNPEGQQYGIIPTTKGPVALSEALGDESVTVSLGETLGDEGVTVSLGKDGDVLLDIPEQTRKRGKPRIVVIFDPFIQPAPDDLCVEIVPGNIVCDFENALPFQRPGIHWPGNTRQSQEAKIVYQDGTSQIIMPTLLSPDTFIKLGFEFEGVEDIVFNANGTFYVLYKSQPYLIVPNFEVQTIEENEPREPSIVVNDDATLTYTIAIEVEEETNTRKRGKSRQVMQFKPQIQIAPDDLCVEILPGEIVCDFDHVL
jgi:hypothetical protein